MNLIFLTMSPFYDLDAHNIYADLLREFVAHGHRSYLVAPCEKKNGMPTELIDKGDYSVLRVRIGNTANVSFIEKGISTVLLERQYIHAIKQHLKNVRFNLILYSTPPVTLAGVVKYLKCAYHAPTYLMLKDIFPQNAVDLGLMAEKSILHRYFKAKERTLYSLSDRIGCMSQANVEYILAHNLNISKEKVDICPNAITPHAVSDCSEQVAYVRKTYNVPANAVIYLYGGNLGKPQGIPFLIDCLKANIGKPDRFFIICGSGSEYHVLKEFIDATKPDNIRLIEFLPKAEYDALAQGCDVGLIFLDYRFSIPNYPSRILSYMENKMPVVICADDATDVGTDAEKGGYGIHSSSNNVTSFMAAIDKMCASDLNQMGKAARTYLEQHFSTHECYKTIMNRCTSL